MKKVLLSLAVAGLAVSAQSAFAQLASVNGKPIPVVNRTTCGKENFFPIAEAYPAMSLPLNERVPGLTCNVFPNRRICGVTPGADNTTAAPGALCLQTTVVGGAVRLDLNCFARCINAGFGTPRVQSVRLIKVVPASNKCPFIFRGDRFVQIGPDIRTWWTLIYTPPGTTFQLDVTTVCQGDPFAGTGGKTEIHIDRYRFRVIVTFESLLNVIEVLHSNTLGTSEIPCIASEDVYFALRNSVIGIRAATGQFERQERLFNTEALVLAFCCIADCFGDGTQIFADFPPGNDTQACLDGGFAGIIDTFENPCCCKLLVDLERLAEVYGIVEVL